jgi:hypothetical protein
VKADHRHYLPLAVGNSWTYTNGTAEKTFSIIGTERIDGKIYYKFDHYFSPLCFSEEDVLLRYDPNSDEFVQLAKRGYEVLGDWVRCDFSGEPYGFCGNQLVQTGASYSVPAGQFDDCVTFSYGRLCDCGEYYDTMAPRLGCIRFEYATAYETFLLKSYRVLPQPHCGDPNHPYPVGDLNQDCRVDLVDLAIMCLHWLDCTAPECNQRPEVYITSPEEGAVIHHLIDSMWVEVDAWDADGKVVKVEFFIDGRRFAEDTSGMDGWNYVTRPPAPLGSILGKIAHEPVALLLLCRSVLPVVSSDDRQVLNGTAFDGS